MTFDTSIVDTFSPFHLQTSKQCSRQLVRSLNFMWTKYQSSISIGSRNTAHWKFGLVCTSVWYSACHFMIFFLPFCTCGSQGKVTLETKILFFFRKCFQMPFYEPKIFTLSQVPIPHLVHSEPRVLSHFRWKLRYRKMQGKEHLQPDLPDLRNGAPPGASWLRVWPFHYTGSAAIRQGASPGAEALGLNLVFFLPILTFGSNCWENPRPCVPESVSNPVSKVHEVFFVHCEQITRVEVRVSLLEDISDNFRGSLTFAPLVSIKFKIFFHLNEQEAGVVCKEWRAQFHFATQVQNIKLGNFLRLTSLGPDAESFLVPDWRSSTEIILHKDCREYQLLQRRGTHTHTHTITTIFQCGCWLCVRPKLQSRATDELWSTLALNATWNTEVTCCSRKPPGPDCVTDLPIKVNIFPQHQSCWRCWWIPPNLL